MNGKSFSDEIHTFKDHFTQIFGMKYYRNLGRKDHMGERVVSKNYLEKVLHNCGLVKLFSVSHFSETFFFFFNENWIAVLKNDGEFFVMYTKNNSIDF